ncbi:hypothetical protein PVAP13_5KG362200 [Panicum virgatum]|uniref:Uncharacterized protein n=1 Tax=Panicum virgatum TaxID=38727 RepID=A0A8T0SMS6_PANVG|nr:hypothetical protein PVAP13_5KG362200 [Panicum virgatum]
MSLTTTAKGCPLKKAGIRPKQQVRRQPPPFAATTGEEEEGTEQQAVVEVMTEQLQPTVQPLIVQESMLSQMLSQVTDHINLSIDHGPLPSSSFIDNNQPTSRPVVLTTATKQGRSKAKNQAKKRNETSTGENPGKKKKKSTKPELMAMV